MKLLKGIFSILVIFCVFGCNDGGGGGGDSGVIDDDDIYKGQPPLIENIEFVEYDDDGSAGSVGSDRLTNDDDYYGYRIYILDIDKDATFAYVSVTDPNGKTIILQVELNQIKTRIIGYTSIVQIQGVKGVYTVEIYAVDAMNNESKVIKTTFKVGS